MNARIWSRSVGHAGAWADQDLAARTRPFGSVAEMNRTLLDQWRRAEDLVEAHGRVPRELDRTRSGAGPWARAERAGGRAR